MKRFSIAPVHVLMVFAMLALSSVCVQAGNDSYTAQTIEGPLGATPEASGIDFTADGKVVVCFRRGSVYVYDPQTDEWSLFATGLHQPLGIVAGKPNEFFVVQIPELTRIVDEDGDGKADLYETINDDWGLSGNYHEFITGPVRDSQGNFYISLGLASTLYKQLPEEPVRGKLDRTGWKTNNPLRGRVNELGHFSPVPYRGWIVKVTPEGEMIPWASGFRQPNGLCLNPHDELFAIDNQGDWVGTSPLYHITQGSFYGHPASLVWDRNFKDGVLNARIDELDAMRKKPAILFPHGEFVNSLSQPVVDTTQGKFGPYDGQMIIADHTRPRLLRVYLEKIDGVYQGAAFVLFQGGNLREGTIRMVYSPKGELYMAQTSRGWGSAEGIQRVTYNGKLPFDIKTMELTHTGFKLTFTKPLAAGADIQSGQFSINHYTYLYHRQYGSPKVDMQAAKITHVRFHPDANAIYLDLDELHEGRVYELNLRDIQSADGESPGNDRVVYTLHKRLPSHATE